MFSAWEALVSVTNLVPVATWSYERPAQLDHVVGLRQVEAGGAGLLPEEPDRVQPDRRGSADEIAEDHAGQPSRAGLSYFESTWSAPKVVHAHATVPPAAESRGRAVGPGRTTRDSARPGPSRRSSRSTAGRRPDSLGTTGPGRAVVGHEVEHHRVLAAPARHVGPVPSAGFTCGRRPRRSRRWTSTGTWAAGARR